MNNPKQQQKDAKYREMDLTPPSMETEDLQDRTPITAAPSLPGEEESVSNRQIDTDSDDSDLESEKQDHAGEPDDLDIAAELEAALANHKDLLDTIDGEESEDSDDVTQDLEDASRNQQEMLNEMDGNVDGNEMEDGTSRPDDFSDQQNPTDMGLSEDEDSPDLSQVLMDGLDNHAENIQKEKVITMVSEALEGFKANKQILERAREKAPELYESCISMLRAMIEMSKMLGLGEEENPLEDGSEEPNTSVQDESQGPDQTPETVENQPSDYETDETGPAPADQPPVADKQKIKAAPGGAAKSPQQ